MAPKRAKKMVIRSSKKVVQQSVEVSVVSSNKRATRGNKDIQIGEEEVDTLKQEQARIIPVQEVTPQTEDNSSEEVQETFPNGGVQNEAEKGVKKMEPKEPSMKKEQVKKTMTQNGNDGEKENSSEGQETFPNGGVQNEAEKGVKKVEPEMPPMKKEQVKKAKTQNGNDGGKEKRKRKRRNVEGYQRYVYRVLKQVHPDMGISSQAMTILNNLMNDMFERLADEAAKLNTYTGRMTLSSREIQGAVKLILPGELGKHAIAEGAKADKLYILCMNHDA